MESKPRVHFKFKNGKVSELNAVIAERLEAKGEGVRVVVEPPRILTAAKKGEVKQAKE
jgi:hypothetical protein